MKRTDFMFWGIGLFFLYVGFKSQNPTLDYQVYVPYSWEMACASACMVLMGFCFLLLPYWIDQYEGLIKLKLGEK